MARRAFLKMGTSNDAQKGVRYWADKTGEASLALTSKPSVYRGRACPTHCPNRLLKVSKIG